MDEDPFAKNAQGIRKTYHEVFLLKKYPQTKLQVRNMNINCHDLYYTVIKNRDDREIVDNQFENDYIIFIDIITHNYYLRRKNIIEILK